MKETLSRMEMLGEEIDWQRINASLTEARLYDALSKAQETKGKQKVEGFLGQSAATRADAAAARSEQLRHRLTGLREQRAQLRAYHAQSLDRMAAAEAAMGAAMVQGLSSAVGAPPWAVDIAKGGSPEQVLKKAALSYIEKEIAGNPALRDKLVSNLGSLKSAAKDLGDVYAKASAFKETLDLYKGRAEHISALLRQPTMNGIVELGETAWQTLPADEKAKWTSRISTSKPALELAAVLAKPGPIAEKLKANAFEYVAKQAAFPSVLDNAVAVTMISRLREAKDEASSLYSEWSKVVPLDRLSPPEINAVFDSRVRVSADWIVRSMPASTQAALAKTMGVKDANDLARRIAERGMKAFPQLTVAGTQATVLLVDGSVAWRQDLTTMLKLEPEAIGLTTATATAELERALRDFAKTGPALREQVVKLMAPQQMEVALRSLVAPNDRINVSKAQEAWGSIVEQSGNDFKAKVLERLGATELGVAVAHSQLVEQQAKASVQLVQSTKEAALPPRKASGAGLKPEEQAAIAAAQAAFPGAATAAIVAQRFVDSMVEMAAATAWMEDINARLEANVASEARVVDLHEAAELDANLSSREIKVHETLQKAYAESFDILAAGADAGAKDNQKSIAAISLRRSLALYLAEQMRMHFDSFNLSLSRWGNYPLRPRDQTFRMLGADPQNFRLALDPEIQLFKQFDRDKVEALKTDVDRLLNHWRAMFQYSEAACDLIGCKGAKPAASVNETELLRLCAFLSPREREQFQRWQKNGTEPFRAVVYLDPALLKIDAGVSSSERNHRFIELRAAGIPAKAGEAPCSSREDQGDTVAFVKLTDLRVTHPGVGYVFRGGGVFDRETLMLRQSTPGPEPLPFDIESLRGRWSNPKRKEMEGLPLVTELEFEIPTGVRGKSISDIGFRIAYQFVDTRNVVNEEQYLARNSGPKISPFAYQFELPSGRIDSKDLDNRPISINARAQIVRVGMPAIQPISRVSDAIQDDMKVRPPLTSVTAGLKERVLDFSLVRACREMDEVVEDLVQDMARAEMAKGSGGSMKDSSLRWDRASRLAEEQRPRLAAQARTLVDASKCATSPLQLLQAR